MAAAGLTLAGEPRPGGLAWAAVNEQIGAAAAAAPLQMKFQGHTAEELGTWQNAFAAKLRELIGPTEPPAQWSVREISTENFPDHVREELVLSANDAPARRRQGTV